MASPAALQPHSDQSVTRPRETVCTNPATGEEIGRSALDAVEDVKTTVARLRAAQPAWAATPLRQRVAMIRRVRTLIVDRADELADIISRDNGKTRVDAMVTEVIASTMAASYYARRARHFLRDRWLFPANPVLANKLSKIRRVPFGVVGIVAPWNYPFSIPFSEIVTALLAGNTVIFKAASQTQLVGRALERIFRDAGFSPDVFAHLNLPGALAGDALLEAGINKLFFTGSVPVGKKLMAKAAETLTPVSLELGGNDPMLVCADADIDRAAAGAVWAGLQNSGQSCGGVERIYVHEAVYDRFLELLADKVRTLRVGPDKNFDVDMGSMTTASQRQIVREHVQDAVDRGAVVYAQSPCPTEGPGLFHPAMVLTNVDHTMKLMRDETFGPVVGVMKVRDMDEAVRLANDSNLGLTASVWSRNRRAAETLAYRLEAGAVTINDHLMSHGLAETPWGGFKESSIGRTHGDIGFDEMTQPQCLVNDLLPMASRNLWWHPFSPQVYAGLRGLIEGLYAPSLVRRARGWLALGTIAPRMFKR